MKTTGHLRKKLPDDIYELRLFFHLRPSWRERISEKITYVGDSRWEHDVTLFLNWIEIDERINSIPEGKLSVEDALVEESSVPKQKSRKIPKTLKIPLCNLPKNQLLTSLVAVDANGTSLFICQRSASARWVLDSLNSFLSHYGIPLSNDEAQALLDAFTDIIMSKEQKEYAKKIANRLCQEIEGADDSNKLWEKGQAAAIVRWLIETYIDEWVPLVRIQYNRIISATITYRYSQTWSTEVHSKKYDWRPGKRISFPLDMLGTSENEHVVIVAPSMTRFLPCKPSSQEKQRFASVREKLYQAQKMELLEEGLDEADIEREDDVAFGDLFVIYSGATDGYEEAMSEAESRGELTPEHAIVRTRMLDNYGEPYRRVGSQLKYYLQYRLQPRIDGRGMGLVLFPFLSLAAVILSWLLLGIHISRGGFTLDTRQLLDGSFSIFTLLPLAPLLATLVINREPKLYIREMLFRVPKWTTNIVICIDVVFLLLFFLLYILGQLEAVSLLCVVEPVANNTFFPLICFILIVSSLICGIWWICHRMAKLLFDRKGQQGFAAEELPMVPEQPE